MNFVVVVVVGCFIVVFVVVGCFIVVVVVMVVDVFDVCDCFFFLLMIGL